MSTSTLMFIVGFGSSVVIGTTLSVLLRSTIIGVILGILASWAICAVLMLTGVGVS